MKFRIAFKMISILLLATMVIVPCAKADYFEMLDSISSTFGFNYWSMAQMGGYIALGEGPDSGNGLAIINVTDPSRMELASHTVVEHMTYYLDWVGNYIYVPGGFDGLYIYDVSDNQQPTLASHMILGDDPTSGVGIRGSTALVGSDWNGSGGGLFSVAVDDPYHPSLIGSSDTIGCGDIILSQTLAFSFTWCNEIKILDISRPERPVQISRFSCPEVDAIDVDETRHLLYATCFSYGLLIYDISNPSMPALLSMTDLPNNSICIDVCHSKICRQILFISGYITGLWAVDTTDPIHPWITANFDTPGGQTNCVHSDGDLVFVTSPNSLFSVRFYQGEIGISDDLHGTPDGFSLRQNFPNPFNNITSISYFLPEKCIVKLEIFDALGRKINTLFDGYQGAGENICNWNAANLSSGTYYYKLSTADNSVAHKMTLLK
jgi:hypothetical protein